MEEISCDIAIVGGGPAGYMAALRATALGADVVLIESGALGGVCLNVGCIPTKAFMTTAELLMDFSRSNEHGISKDNLGIDWQAAVARKDRIVRNLQQGLVQLLGTRGIRVIDGKGLVVSPTEVIVKKAALQQEDAEAVRVSCAKLILASGSSATKLSIPGVNLPGVVYSSDMLALTKLPSTLIILGGGVIGLEFAAIFAAAGVKVTVIERERRLLADEDDDVSDEILKLMKRQGIAFRLQATAQQITQNDDSLNITYSQGERIDVITAEKILCAIGRKANLEAFTALSLDLENGAIAVNERMETNISNVYAAGDVIGGKLLAHLAFAEGKVAAENACGLSSSLDYRAVPSCIYTSPEYAAVGLNETEAQRRGIKPRIGRFSFRHNGRAQTLGERDGFVKIVADESGCIIGAQILGAKASELISEMTLAVKLQLKAEVIAEMIHPHPALGEALWEACARIAGMPIHMGL